MLNKLPNKIWFWLLGAITALSTVLMSLPITFLHISSSDFQCASRLPALQLQWIHSVEKEHWRENYQISGQQLLLTSTQFKTFGAGTPSSGHAITRHHGWLQQQVNRLLPRINWVISANVESTLLSQLGTWPIYQDLDDYAEVQIQVNRASRWHYFTQESCDDYFKKS